MIKVITERKIAEEIEVVVIFAMAMFYFSIMSGSIRLYKLMVYAELLFLIGEAAHRNILDIYLNTFARISHLFVRLGFIGWLCWSLRKQSQPYEESIAALDTSGISSFEKPEPKLGKTELWLAPPIFD